MDNSTDVDEPVLGLFKQEIDEPEIKEPKPEDEFERVRQIAAADAQRRGREALVRPGVYIPD